MRLAWGVGRMTFAQLFQLLAVHLRGSDRSASKGGEAQKMLAGSFPSAPQATRLPNLVLDCPLFRRVAHRKKLLGAGPDNQRSEGFSLGEADMPGIGRRRNVAAAEGAPAGKAPQGLAGVRRHAWRWPRLRSRLTAHQPLPVRNLVTLLGGIVAIVTALSAPIGYGIIGYLKEAQSLQYRAELTAARAAQYIYAPDAPWKYDTDQLAAISEIATPSAVPIVQRLLDNRGAAMMRKGKPLPKPTFARTAPVFASGALVGTAEVSASLRPLLAEVGVVAAGALVLAIAAYLAFAILPLGVIDRTLGEVKAANDKLEQQNLLLDTALENMGQGLAMYDAEARIVIANDRYARLYGLDPDEIKPGTSLRRIVELRMANGLYAGQNADDVYKAMRERRMATNLATQVT